LTPNLDVCMTASLTCPRHKYACVMSSSSRLDRRADLAGRPSCDVHPTISMTPLILNVTVTVTVMMAMLLPFDKRNQLLTPPLNPPPVGKHTVAMMYNVRYSTVDKISFLISIIVDFLGAYMAFSAPPSQTTALHFSPLSVVLITGQQ
jgi:hypothetical protein